MTYEEKMQEKNTILDAMKPHQEEISRLNKELTSLKKGCRHPKRLWRNHGSYFDNELGYWVHPRECSLCDTWLHLTEEQLDEWEDEKE